MIGKRRAALARMQRVIERAKAKQAIAAKASDLPPALRPYDQARIDKWIRDRLVEWRDSCWRCQKPIIVGQAWLTIGNGEVTVRFHSSCHAEWRAEQEKLARKALGLTETTR